MLHHLGREVLLWEWDPANLLTLHLGEFDENQVGFVKHVVMRNDWRTGLMQTKGGLRYMPFGQINGQELKHFESVLHENPLWLNTHLNSIETADDAIVVLDVARFPSVFFSQAMLAASRALVVLLPDAASMMSIDAIEPEIAKYEKPAQYLINKLDATQVLHIDIVTMLKVKLGKKLLPFKIHHDQAVSEAFASGLALYEYAPHSQTTDDLQALANWLTFNI
jgi:chromosome partitioning protein